ncbi:hypothetical protein MHF_0165 [Mycoplasma haemofelis Ohio2]|uniref:Uncharacterized protein n=1 Tax=Mycoplasma haemofelis (strain Ohio2) TaxID=859194 RepID=F6FG00_MYCHI|nr:hypothetical protein MHF_0165 [Mycoplasma haemofelis Ohio2]
MEHSCFEKEQGTSNEIFNPINCQRNYSSSYEETTFNLEEFKKWCSEVSANNVVEGHSKDVGEAKVRGSSNEGGSFTIPVCRNVEKTDHSWTVSVCLPR